MVFPAGVTGSAVSRADGLSISSPTGLTMEIPVGAIDAEYVGAYIKESHPSEIGVPEGSRFIAGSYAGDFVFTDITGEPIPGFRTNVPVRICLPITREDLDLASGGIDGVHVVHWMSEEEFFHYPPDNDFTNMMTCATVDHFSLFFVGLAVGPPKPAAAPTPTTVPTPTPTAAQRPRLRPHPSPLRRRRPFCRQPRTPLRWLRQSCRLPGTPLPDRKFCS